MGQMKWTNFRRLEMDSGRAGIYIETEIRAVHSLTDLITGQFMKDYLTDIF